jgi:tol-pal system protein YbgF
MSSRILSFAGVAALCVGLTGCVTTPPEQDPVVQKLSELDGRLLRLERVLSNQSLLDLSQRLEAAQTEARALRGQIEELQFRNQGAGEQQRELYDDLSKRLQALETSNSQAPALQASAGNGLPVPGGDDRANYQAAFDLLRDGKYAEATEGFKQLLVRFPTSSMADNAQYWLGESYYVTRDFAAALKAFRVVVDKYPESRKLPDALLKIGYCDYELQNWKTARAALGQVVQQFPDTTAARLAQQRLVKMDGEGR